MMQIKAIIICCANACSPVVIIVRCIYHVIYAFVGQRWRFIDVIIVFLVAVSWRWLLFLIACLSSFWQLRAKRLCIVSGVAVPTADLVSVLVGLGATAICIAIIAQVLAIQISFAADALCVFISGRIAAARIPPMNAIHDCALAAYL